MSDALAKALADRAMTGCPGDAVVLSSGSLLLGSADESFECRHEHGGGDRCVSFNYEPAFFERLAADSAGRGASPKFPINRLPELPSLVPLTAEAQLGLHRPRSVNFEELALELAGRVLTTLGASPVSVKGTTIRDERRIATAVRFIELHFRQPMSLEELSALV